MIAARIIFVSSVAQMLNVIPYPLSAKVPQADSLALIELNIAIYDMLGRKIKTLLKQTFYSGTYLVEWNGTDAFDQAVPSGIYVYRLHSARFNAARKMVLIR